MDQNSNVDAILAKAIPGKIASITHTEAQALLEKGAKLTRHTYEPGTGLHECFLSWNQGEKLFVYRGTRRLEVPVPA